VIVQADNDLVGILDHVVVGHDVAVFRDNGTGTQRFGITHIRLDTVATTVFEEVLEQFSKRAVFREIRNLETLWQLRRARLHLLRGTDIDNRRRRFLYQLGKTGQLPCLCVVGHRQQRQHDQH
jgi:hypothetical protein